MKDSKLLIPILVASAIQTVLLFSITYYVNKPKTLEITVNIPPISYEEIKVDLVDIEPLTYKARIFDHSQCQYPNRLSNPIDGCDNSDPVRPECMKLGTEDC